MLVRNALATLALFLSFGAQSLPCHAADNGSSDANAVLTGDWRGPSTCVVKPSGCQDEDSLYHITVIADRPGRFSLKGDKMVAGKPVTMGTVECGYDAGHKLLTCNFAHQLLEFAVQGNQMTGTMKLEDGTVWRKLSLKKVE